MKYSFKKGLGKGIVSALVIAASFVALAGFSDLTIWGLFEQYVKPVLGSVTVGAVLTMIINYIKVKFK